MAESDACQHITKCADGACKYRMEARAAEPAPRDVGVTPNRTCEDCDEILPVVDDAGLCDTCFDAAFAEGG